MTVEAETNERDEQQTGFGWMFIWELLCRECVQFDGSTAFSGWFECSSVGVIAVLTSMSGQCAWCFMDRGQERMVRG